MKSKCTRLLKAVLFGLITVLLSTAASLASIIRVTVSVSNAGWLRSGQLYGRPAAAAFDAKKRALDERGELAKPCR